MRKLCIAVIFLCAACVNNQELGDQLQPIHQQLGQIHQEKTEQELRISMLESTSQEILDHLRLAQPTGAEVKRPVARNVTPTPSGAYVPPPGHAPAGPPPVVPVKGAPVDPDARYHTVYNPAYAEIQKMLPTPPDDPTGTATPAVVQPVPVSPSVVSPTAKPVSGDAGKYQDALSSYENRRYADAEKKFDNYLNTYPTGRYIPNALYWKGETHFAQGRYAEAIMSFKETVTRFPKHQKAADSLLKMVMIYQRLGDADNSAMHLRILQEDFPNSESLRRAEKIAGRSE
jgi:tol-pal system protein YbgF